jgi:hypothetical protein
MHDLSLLHYCDFRGRPPHHVLHSYAVGLVERIKLRLVTSEVAQIIMTFTVINSRKLLA